METIGQPWLLDGTATRSQAELAGVIRGGPDAGCFECSPPVDYFLDPGHICFIMVASDIFIKRYRQEETELNV